MLSRLRRIIMCLACISILNLIFGIYVITTVLSIEKSGGKVKNLSIFNLNNESTSSMRIQRKSKYDYYFRIDYTIIEGVCQPLHLFNTTETIHSIENITNQRINQILSRNIQINLQILKMNTKLEKPSNKLKQRSVKSTKLLCDYLLELFVGIDFPSYCNDICRSTELHRLISNINLLDDSALTFPVRKQNSKGAIIEYYIQNIVLFQTVKYFEEIVFIQAIEQNRYVSITILDSNAYHTSVSMSINDKSLFIIKKGLVSLDPSVIYISFALLSSPNLYLRHRNGRVTLDKYDQSNLFEQDATFKLIFDQQKELVAFQTINLQDYFYLAVDSDTDTTLVVMNIDPKITIDKFDKRFLFKFITTT